MGKHSFKEWMIAVRPWSFPASAMPVAVTLGYLLADRQQMDWLNGVWALLNIVIFHAAGNTWSDYFDYRRKVDDDDTFGAKTITSGMFAAKEILWLSIGLLAVACAAGIGLWARTGMPLLYIGLGGLACSVLYPFLKYRALGDLVIFIAYGLLPVLGTVYAATLTVDWPVLLYLAVPVGLITVAILHCNNLRDTATDRRAHIRTFAMDIGKKASVWVYCFEVLFPFLWITGCVIAGALPHQCLICWAAVVPAWKNSKMAVGVLKSGSESIARLDEYTSKLQLMFSFLLIMAFVGTVLIK